MSKCQCSRDFPEEPFAMLSGIYKVGKCFFIRTSPVLVFQYSHLPTHCMPACSLLHACIFQYSHLPTHCMLACSLLHACMLIVACLHAHCMLAYPYLHCVLAECPCVCVSVSVEVSVYVVRMWWKCQCASVSVEVSLFKGFSGRTLRNAFGKTEPSYVVG